MRHPNPKILAAVLGLALLVGGAFLACPWQDAPARWLEGMAAARYAETEMEVRVPSRLAAVLAERPVPGVRVVAVTDAR